MQEKTKISEQGMNLFLSIFLSFYPRNFPKTFLPDLRATKWSLRKILLLLLLLLHNFKIEILCNIARKTQRGRKYENEFWKRETNGERMSIEKTMKAKEETWMRMEERKTKETGL